jgi:rubrerythrin
MATEQVKTLDALRIALRMEIDGKEFYIKSSQNSGNKMGKKLLRSLASAEDEHRRKFISIYEAIRDQKTWPKTALKPGVTGKLKTVFAAATQRIAAGTKPIAEELDAVQIAMKMENKTLDFYTTRETRATGETEKTFYKSIAAEEREHHMLLESYYEFLRSPADWFVKNEHHSLDGG